MRSRASTLLLLAIVLAVVPIYLRSQASARCAAASGAQDSGPFTALLTSGSDTPDSCFDAASNLPFWARSLGFASALCFCGWLSVGAKRLYERRQERDMLRAVHFAERRRGSGPRV